MAVGGRGTLIGAVLGAVLVSFAETYINDNYNEVFRKYLHGEGWPLLMGGLFVLVVVFLPEGLLGGFNKGIARLKHIASRRPEGARTNTAASLKTTRSRRRGWPGGESVTWTTRPKSCYG